MPASAKRKTANKDVAPQAPSTPTHRNKVARRSTAVSKKPIADDQQQVSLMAGGPVNSQPSHVSRSVTSSLGLASKMTREQEVDWITQLNKRLEVYVAVNKTKDRSVITQMADVRTDEASYKHELTTIATRYGTTLTYQAEQIKELTIQLQQISTNNEELLKKNHLLEGELSLSKEQNSGMVTDYALMQRQINTYKNDMEELLDQKEQLNEELQRIQAENQKLVEELNDEDYDDEDEHDEVGDEMTDEDKGSKRSKKGIKKGKGTKRPSRRVQERAELITLQSKIQHLETLLEIQANQHQTEVEKYTKQTQKLMKENLEKDTQYEKDIEVRIDEALEDAEERHAEELENLRDELTAQFEKKIIAHKNTLQNYIEQVAALNQSKAHLETQLTDYRSAEVELEAENQSLVNQVNILHQHLAEAVDNHSVDIERLEESLMEVKQLYNDKMAEFEELLEVKTSLALEIDQYRKLLEKEEKRVGIVIQSSTPRTRRSVSRQRSFCKTTQDEEEEQVEEKSVKKSTKAPVTTMNDEDEEQEQVVTATPKRKKAATKAKDPESAEIVVSQTSLNGDFVKLRNCAMKAISLHGFSIASDATHNEYKFDYKNNNGKYSASDILLQPNEQIVVYFTKPSRKSASAKQGTKMLIDLSEENLFDPEDAEDNKGQLYDHLHRSVAKIQFSKK